MIELNVTAVQTVTELILTQLPIIELQITVYE